MSLEVRFKKRLSKAFCLEIDITKEQGRLGLLGASGSGKSMTLKCIAGIETPDEGYIAVNGRVLYSSAARINLKPQARRVGYLFQNYALFPTMTVRQNILCGLQKKAGETRLAELVRRFELDGLEQRLPRQLSGGQQQRVALARMLAAGPEVLLLDEPFSALDAHLREHMQLELLNVLREYQDVLLVTHNRDEAYRLCEALAILDAGRVLTMGGAKEVFQNPGSMQAARLTGCKNISRVSRLSETELEAADWGVRLFTARPIPEDIGYIGIRAHDFMPVYGDVPPSAQNMIKVRAREITEDMFEWSILCVNEDKPAAQAIWWKAGKAAYKGMPAYLCVAPEAIMLLR